MKLLDTQNVDGPHLTEPLLGEVTTNNKMGYIFIAFLILF